MGGGQGWAVWGQVQDTLSCWSLYCLVTCLQRWGKYPRAGEGLSPDDPCFLTVMASDPSLPHVDQFQVVWPWRLPTARARRALPSRWSLYPDSVSYILGAGGHNFTLHLRKNRELLGSGYTETYTAANGSDVVEQLQGQDHCLYQGHVEGHQGSAASLSTCEGLRGFFRAGSVVHLIEPLDGAEEGRHALYQAQHLQQKRGTCGVSNASLEHILGPRIAAAFRPRHRPLSQEPRHVELYVVTDSTEFQKLRSREAVRRRVLEVVNHVDKLYQELSLRVALVGLEMWSKDKIDISPQADDTLENFLDWRTKELMGRHAHDNAQLITGVDFSGTTVGLAKVGSMCSRSSAAVNQVRRETRDQAQGGASGAQDHSQNPIGVASTMAHEMGHNLGMDHDENIQGCHCPVPQDSGGCVMAASIGLKFPRMFSQCSRADLETFVENPQTDCLRGALDPGRLVSDPVCGNKFVERGEQCDCGSTQECRDPCCNATYCQLTEGAECAQGACCHKCQVKPAGELCRAPKDVCDLGEYCDGQQPECPEDVFQENGTPCLGGYCHNGACPTLNQRCNDLWGPGTRAAAETCFSYSLLQRCQGSSLSRADPCGILYCQGGQKPPQRTSCAITHSFGHCQALVTEDGRAYETVPVGTRCGEGKVCSHKSECHCYPGWAPPYCAKPVSDMHGASGSLSTGVLVSVVLLVVMLLILVGVAFYLKPWDRHRKRNAAPKTSMGLTNPLFREGGGGGALGKSSAAAPTAGSPEAVLTTYSRQPPRPPASRETPKRPPPVPPATRSSPPFPVPMYTPQVLEQLRPAPPNKPLPELKATQVVRPTVAPPMPPTKPNAGGPTPSQAIKPTTVPPAPPTKLKSAPTQAVGTKIALKPLVQRR
ncbi:disintegrin and metalloproteinase domain-containing protein 8 isoform X4 [Elephas maximus indicus]|uniref:disintegrin and metalloproteinase domain-containing protein 8 isoform X4 n=1 Tax=Elephas maximus indicus TaxID=99487 RepID=UPI0021172B00|nr:disintegrin and metalloproteinase domain-containing protein 8 isoform X4 [Elephas maximus indicus]